MPNIKQKLSVLLVLEWAYLFLLLFQSIQKPLTLEEFLKLPETQPASEYIDGEIIQKPMPKGKHSRLQLKLCDRINEVAEGSQIASAFPELRYRVITKILYCLQHGCDRL